MVDIFDEVDEELRADRARRAMQRYGWVLSALLVLVVAGVAGWQGWRWWQDRAALQAGTAFLATAEAAAAPDADLKALAERFSALAAEAPPGYRALSRLRGAALRAAAGEREAALAEWDLLARDEAVERLYRDLASLLWALHGLDSADPALLEARLAPLAAEGPWRASAKEMLALVAIRRGDTAAARERLQALSEDSTAPQGVRDRAGRLLTGLAG